MGERRKRDHNSCRVHFHNPYPRSELLSFSTQSSSNSLLLFFPSSPPPFRQAQLRAPQGLHPYGEVLGLDVPLIHAMPMARSNDGTHLLEHACGELQSRPQKRLVWGTSSRAITARAMWAQTAPKRQSHQVVTSSEAGRTYQCLTCPSPPLP